MSAETPAPLLLADHPVLDLLNTRMMVEGHRQDLLTDGVQAVEWLHRVGLPLEDVGGEADRQRLLEQLRTLRDVIEPLVLARGQGVVADPQGLNGFLRNAVVQLMWTQEQGVVLDRSHDPDPVTRCICKLALEAATLLAEGDFTLVRLCESHDCTLMFYDRTKSLKRRWCSMAVCGNRHKVAEFRKRRQGL